MQTWFQRFKWAVILVLIQVLILNHIHLGMFAVPLLYVYFMLKQSSDFSPVNALLWAFAIGLTVDIFSNTPGMNATAAIWTALLRKPLLKLNVRADATEAFVPSVRAMGFGSYLGYVVLIVFAHSFIFNLLDDFSFFRPLLVLQKSVMATVDTTILIFCFDAMRRRDV